ncbi:MAG: phosphatase PAP2 family protein, partial [Methanobacteriaceae archaeon]
AILMLLLGDEKTKKLGIWAIITMVIIQIVVSIIKVTVGEPRPFETLANVRVLDPIGGYSFPSGHSTLSFALGILLGANYKIKAKLFKDKNGNPREFSAIYPLLIFAAIVAFSRPYVGVHYPFDVISGSLIGVIIGIIMLKLYRRTNKIKTNNNNSSKAN